MPATPEVVVGIDSAAASFVMAWLKPGSAPSAPQTFAQTSDGIAALHRDLQHQQITPETTLVVMEATGNYWMTAATLLHQYGYQVSVPRTSPYFR